MPALFRSAVAIVYRPLPRSKGHGHNKQLYGQWVEISALPASYARSIFAVCDVYNNLSQHGIDAVDATDVCNFQNIWFKLPVRDASKATLHGHRLFAAVLENFVYILFSCL